MQDHLAPARQEAVPVQMAGNQRQVDAAPMEGPPDGMDMAALPGGDPGLRPDAVQTAPLLSHWAEGSGSGQPLPGPVQLKCSPGGVVQCFVETPISGKDWRIADDLTMAIRQDSPVYGGRHFYADSGLITTSNDTLKKQSSQLGLKAGSGTMKVKSTDGTTTKDLTRVEPTNKDDKSSGSAKGPAGMQWPDDCGVAANSIMQGGDRKGKAVYSGPPQGFLEKIISYVTGKKSFERETKESSYGSDTETYKGAPFYSPHILLDEIFKAAMGDKDAEKAWAKYQALSPADKDKFDKEVGINKYAQAEVGESYSIVASKDDFLGGKSAWNFHWGGVIMRSGGDSVTMENFANSGTDAWDFQMYGPPTKAGQTFHEQQEKRMHGSTREYGDNPTTIRVRKGG